MTKPSKQKIELNQEIPGFLFASEWVWIDCDWDGLKPRDGAQPLRAEFSTALTVRQAMSLPNPFAAGVTIQEISDAVSPHIRAWNVTAVNLKTGAVEPVPPPAEIGIEAFKDTRPAVAAWCGFILMQLHVQGGPDRPLETTPSDDMSDGESVAA